ncbi:MAG: hypothetical protein K2M63_05320 [Muribaculaceae bacterium]|nr:hypothetical protein [Muribaculaceae bacterium]
MKKFNFSSKALLGAVVLAGTLFTSCEPSTGEASQTILYPALNYISFSNGDTPMISWGAYTFNFNYTEQKESISTTSLTVNNINYGFATNGVKYEDISPSRGMGVYASGFTANVGQANALGDCQFYLTSFPIPSGMEYVPSKKWIPTVEKDGKTTYHSGAMYRPDYDIPPLVIGSYSVGNLFDVITCSTDMSFFGKTVTTYPGGEYENNGMVYRIFIDVNSKTADVVIYDAKFADKAPSLAVVYLPSLPMTLKNGSFEINGTDIIPKVPEGTDMNAVLVDYPNYIFKSFHFSTVEGTLLSKAKISYNVGEAFSATFEGQYAELPARMFE